MIRTIIAAALLALISSAVAAEDAVLIPWFTPQPDGHAAVMCCCPREWDRVIGGDLYCAVPAAVVRQWVREDVAASAFDGRDGAPIALPKDEDATRMRRIEQLQQHDNGYGGREPPPGGYGWQGICTSHPDWRGCH